MAEEEYERSVDDIVLQGLEERNYGERLDSRLLAIIVYELRAVRKLLEKKRSRRTG